MLDKKSGSWEKVRGMFSKLVMKQLEVYSKQYGQRRASDQTRKVNSELPRRKPVTSSGEEK